jgi:hypothetical protein
VPGRARPAANARERLGRLAAVLLAAGALACAAPDAGDGGGEPVHPLLLADPVVLPTALAQAAGGGGYAADSLGAPRAERGWLSGTVEFDGRFPEDTTVRPTHDLHACRPRPDAPMVGTSEGVGEALVWLVGASAGPADPAPRRHTITLQGCRIVPRLTRVPQGATVIVRSADAMDARLRFVEVQPTVVRPSGGDSTPAPLPAPPSRPRALVPLGDAGALVPLTAVAEAPGLVEIRDDRHPWVRGWLAVAPHPFVMITDPTGRFAFDEVPPGAYVLVAWHERLGAVAMPVRVDAQVEARVRVVIPERR